MESIKKTLTAGAGYSLTMRSSPSESCVWRSMLSDLSHIFREVTSIH